MDVDGAPGFVLARDRSAATTTTKSVRLLPHYDCYLIGCATPGEPRARLVPEAAGSRVFDRGAGPLPALLVDGVVAGVWERRRRRGRLELRVEPFALDRRRREEVEAESRRIAAFLNASVDLSLG
jgi:hypothetical protein